MDIVFVAVLIIIAIIICIPICTKVPEVTRDNISVVNTEIRNVAIMADNMIPPDQIMTVGVTGGCGGCGNWRKIIN